MADLYDVLITVWSKNRTHKCLLWLCPLSLQRISDLKVLINQHWKSTVNFLTEQGISKVLILEHFSKAWVSFGVLSTHIYKNKTFTVYFCMQTIYFLFFYLLPLFHLVGRKHAVLSSYNNITINLMVLSKVVLCFCYCQSSD